MAERRDYAGGEVGPQFVLDTRRILVGFVILVVLCGGFFILGFVEGKRQAVSGGASGNSPTVPDSPPQVLDSGNGEHPVSSTSDVAKSLVREPVAAPPPAAKPAEMSRATTPAPEPRAEKASEKPRVAPSPGKQGYSVQVGAFRLRKEADVKAKDLRAKGYDSSVETPQAPDQLFLLLVGRFDSRADAVAMQLKLKKDGFSSFVKSR
jgi:cell division protein FtsN